MEHLLSRAEAIPITEASARVHAEVWADVGERGRMIGAQDLWIAAAAISHGMGVATRNAGEFGHVYGLRVLSPG